MEMNRTKSSHFKINPRDFPAILGGTPVFEKSADVPYPRLDEWQQITEEEAQVVYEMTLRNELSGASPTVQKFERIWRERHQTRFALSLTERHSSITQRNVWGWCRTWG